MLLKASLQCCLLLGHELVVALIDTCTHRLWHRLLFKFGALLCEQLVAAGAKLLQLLLMLSVLLLELLLQLLVALLPLPVALLPLLLALLAHLLVLR